MPERDAEARSLREAFNGPLKRQWLEIQKKAGVRSDAALLELAKDQSPLKTFTIRIFQARVPRALLDDYASKLWAWVNAAREVLHSTEVSSKERDGLAAAFSVAVPRMTILQQLGYGGAVPHEVFAQTLKTEVAEEVVKRGKQLSATGNILPMVIVGVVALAVFLKVK